MKHRLKDFNNKCNELYISTIGVHLKSTTVNKKYMENDKVDRLNKVEIHGLNQQLIECQEIIDKFKKS